MDLFASTGRLKRLQMSKKLILYVSYAALIDGKMTFNTGRIKATPMQWLFPIIIHQQIIKSLEEEGCSKINVISLLRSYLD